MSDIPTVSGPDFPMGEGPRSLPLLKGYKIVKQLGEGGMGIVYLAEQTERIKRQVALKIVKPGMDSRTVIARFEAERQALAMLDHPNIAHVYDAGTTDKGRPYFVMEYIHGIPITDYCDQQELSIEDRLVLFKQVCEGIQHAHQRGIIHRDIKPSNILVIAEGEKAIPRNIVVSIGKSIRIWDFKGKELKLQLPTISRKIECIAISEDGNVIAFQTFARPIIVWNLESNTLINSIEQKARVKSLLFSQNAEKIVYLPLRDIHIYDLTANELKIIESESIHSKHSLNGITHDNNLVTTEHTWPANIDIVRTWNLNTGELISSAAPISRERRRDSELIYGSQFAAKPLDSENIKIFDLKTGNDYTTIEGRLPVSFTPDSKSIVVTKGKNISVMPIGMDQFDKSLKDIVEKYKGTK